MGSSHWNDKLHHWLAVSIIPMFCRPVEIEVAMMNTTFGHTFRFRVFNCLRCTSRWLAVGETFQILRASMAMLPRIDWTKGSTTPAPDGLCPSSPGLQKFEFSLWPTNSVRKLSVVRVIRFRVIQNTQFAVINPKRNETVRSIIRHQVPIWLTSEFMHGCCGYP